MFQIHQPEPPNCSWTIIDILLWGTVALIVLILIFADPPRLVTLGVYRLRPTPGPPGVLSVRQLAGSATLRA